MSAVVCGSKRSYFDDLPSPTSPPVSKRLRCSSTSPIRRSPPSLLDQLTAVFPQMEPQVLERALEECGYNVDAAIKRLHELSLGSLEGNSGTAEEANADVEKVILKNNGDNAAAENASNDLPVDGAGWAELFVREMMGATSLDDAKVRASRVLEILERSIVARAGAEVSENIQKENQVLKEQIEGLIRENSILKRAVAIQHERQKEYDNQSQELQHLKQLLSQYQEQLRTAEVNNYSLAMHLKQAQQSSSFPGRYNPDIF